MPTQNPNTWEAFYNSIQQQKDTPGGEAILNRIEELHHSAQHDTSEDFQKNVTDLLHTYGNQFGLSSEANGQDILQEANAWREEKFPLSEQPLDQRQTVEQIKPDIFDKAAALLNQKGPEVARGHIGDSASPAIRSLQEQRLLHAFDDALTLENEEERRAAIDKILSNLDAPALLKDQMNILQKSSAERMEETSLSLQEKKQHEQLQRNLPGLADKSLKAMQAARESTDPLQKARNAQRLERDTQLTNALRQSTYGQTLDKNAAREKFRALLRHRQAETAAFPMLNVYLEYDEPYLLQLSRIMAAIGQREQQERLRRLQALEEESGPVDEGLYVNGQNVTQQQAQQANNKTNAYNNLKKFNNLQKAGKKGDLEQKAVRAVEKNLKKKGVKEGEKLAEKGAGKLMQRLLLASPGCAIIFLVAMIFIIIIVIIMSPILSLTGAGSGGSESFSDCQAVPSTVAGIQSAMASLGFGLNGDLSSGNNGYHKASIAFQTVCNLSHSQKYMSLIGAPHSPVGIYIRTSTDCINDQEHNPGDGDICHIGPGFYFNYCVNVGSGCRDDYINEYNLGHELGHIIENRNPSLFQQFLHTIWDPNNRPPLWACWFHAPYPNSDPAECFADLQGEYLTYNVWRSIWWAGDGGGKLLAGATFDGYQLTKTFSEYPIKFANYFNFFRENVFGGVAYQYGVSQSAPNPESSQPGVGLCDKSYFVSTFGDQASNASCICRHESQGFAQATANTCGGINLHPNSSPEFSVGLFQINLHVHPDFNSCINVPALASTDKKIASCSYNKGDIIYQQDQNALLSCLDSSHALDPRIQAQEAYKLYEQAGNSWTPWYNSAKACGIL